LNWHYARTMALLAGVTVEFAGQKKSAPAGRDGKWLVKRDPLPADADKPAEYAQSLPAWIKRLRAEWGRDDFHFLIVMLPGFNGKLWPEFREVQLGIPKTPHTSVANTIDLGDEKDIHPPDKMPICERLALLARRDVYGEKIEAQGPVFKSATVKGNRVVIESDHAAGLKTTDGVASGGFQPTKSWGSVRIVDAMRATEVVANSAVTSTRNVAVTNNNPERIHR
jgi:hypothetical protein